jgi:hypothetical protein
VPHITAFAKASTPFGPIAGRTAITVVSGGQDLAVIEFTAGPTPVMLSIGDSNLHAFIEALAEVCNQMHAQRVKANLPATLEVAS